MLPVEGFVGGHVAPPVDVQPRDEKFLSELTVTGFDVHVCAREEVQLIRKTIRPNNKCFMSSLSSTGVPNLQKRLKSGNKTTPCNREPTTC
jgi:hypothetical protein